MIDPISATNHILSYFSRTATNGSETTVTQVRHIEQNGVTKVEEITFTTYNSKGEAVEIKSDAPKVDITI